MLSAGRAHQQARRIWIALGSHVHADAALNCSRELSFLASGAATVVDDARGVAPSANDADQPISHAACFSGRSEAAGALANTWAGPRARGLPSTARPALPTPASAASAGLGTALRLDTLSVFIGGSVLPTAATAPPGAGAHALLPLLGGGGRRCYHAWYYGSQLRNRAILSISSLDQLGELLRQNGDKLDHINLAVFLRKLQLLASHAAAASSKTGPAAAVMPALQPPASYAAQQPPPASDDGPASGYGGGGGGGGGSAASPSTVVAAVAAASSRATEQHVQMLVAEALRLVRRRSKWYDPRNAASVVACTASLGYTDGRVLHDMTGRTLARLNEAYSRDLLLLLRGLTRHAQLSAAAAAAAAPVLAAQTATAAATAAAGGDAAPAAAAAAQRPDYSVVVAAAGVGGGGRGGRPSKPWWQRARRPARYVGPPEGLLAGVEAFLVAKIPTGRMPPENVDGLLRCLRELSPGDRPLGRELLATAEADLRRRMVIYAPEPLAGVLATLASERHPLPPDLLDSAATHFAEHADTYGTGAAAARFLTAAAAPLPQSGGGGGGEGASAPSSSPSSPSSSPSGEWLVSRPELLSQCLRLMSRDLPTASVGRLVAWMETLNRAGLPLASLASVANPPGATAARAAAEPQGPAAAKPTSAPTTSVAAPAAAAAATFVRAHGAAVERAVARQRLTQEGVAQLRELYDGAGLPYPTGL